MLQNASNKELIRLWNAGQQAAAHVLVERFFVRLIALTRKRIHPQLATRFDPEDIVLSAWRSFFVGCERGRFDVPADDDLWPLLMTLTLRKLARKVAQQSAECRQFRRDVSLNSPAAATDWLACDPSPEQAIDFAEELEVVLRQLSQADRDILLLRLEGEPHVAIAERLQISDRTVRRGLQRIREIVLKRMPEATAHAKPETPDLFAGLLPSAPPQRKRPPPTSHTSSMSPELKVIPFDQLFLKQMIGFGGMGKVYRADWRTSGAEVAVKFLRKRMWHRPGVVQRLQHESRVMHGIQHPHIVRHFGWGETPGQGCYLVMELVNGGNVEHWRERAEPSLGQIVQCGMEVAEALKMAHSRGIVHGDVTPRNVLLNETVGFVLTDFGFSQTLATPTTPLGGTPAFLAPEQVSPLFGEIDARTDVYGLCGLLFWLITGQTPITGGDWPTLWSNLLSTAPPVWPDARGIEIPASLQALLVTGLQKEIANRPPTIAQLQHKLQACQTDSTPF